MLLYTTYSAGNTAAAARALHVFIRLKSCVQIRRQAEAALEHAKLNAEAAVPALLNEACSSSNADVRLMAAVVLKKWIPSTWKKLPADVRSSLKDSLLKASVFSEGATALPMYTTVLLDSYRPDKTRNCSC